jgi:uncharacterized membrane protein
VRLAALLLALCAAGSWGVGGVLLKRGTDVVSPATILVFQYVVGVIGVGTWLLVSRNLDDTLAAVGRRWPALLLLVSLQIAGYVLFVVAVRYAGDGSLPTATVVAIAASYPALVAVLSGPLLGEQLHWNHALGVALVVCGVIVAQAL